MLRSWLSLLVAVIVAGVVAAPARALDGGHQAKAQEMIDKGLAFLRANQGADGSWSAKPGGPAVTAMVLRVMLDRSGARSDDPAARKALDYILSKARPDGGIHDGILENYNTAICLSALAKVKGRPDLAPVIKRAQDYLRDLQWAVQQDPEEKRIDEKHAFYGGAGYGKEGRPDLSNTQIMLEGLHDSGLDASDPAFQRALVFITRCQGTPANKDFGDKIKPDGGFIYSTSLTKDKIGQPESKAGEETVDVPGSGPVSRLRTYGSMTYAGFKSYLYANLDRKDQRVIDAYNWIRRNYTLDHNPGLPEAQKMQGFYYYLMTYARALDAWGQPTLTTADGKLRDWGNDLVDKLAALQRPDGSWVNTADRWMEGDPNLTTAYALIALTHAR